MRATRHATRPVTHLVTATAIMVTMGAARRLWVTVRCMAGYSKSTSGTAASTPQTIGSGERRAGDVRDPGFSNAHAVASPARAWPTGDGMERRNDGRF